MSILESYSGALPGRRMWFAAMIIACLTMPFAIFGCFGGKSEEKSSCDDGCFNIVDYCKEQDWSSGQACNSCVIACVGDLLNV